MPGGRILTAALAATLLIAVSAHAAPSGTAPGAPGTKGVWTEADKDGYGTSATRRSKVWYTLDDGILTEVYYPDLSTPSVRDLQLVVSDGRRAWRERESTSQRVELLDRNGLVNRQVNTARSRDWRITKTYVTDPRTNALLVRVGFRSLSGKRYRVFALYDPGLNNTPDDDSGTSGARSLWASDSAASSVLLSSTGFDRTSSGYLDTSDGWRDLRADGRLNNRYRNAPNGNVVQTGRMRLDGKRRRQATLALGFGAETGAARAAAGDALRRGFGRALRSYRDGWLAYLRGLKPTPRSARKLARSYRVSLMTLAAHEDKTNRGAYIASPSMPWAWGLLTIDSHLPSGPYHLVWPRDQYQVATALLAAGDRAGAERALDYMLQRQQRDDGSMPQNTHVDGTERWTQNQMDQVAFPIVLAWQLGRFDAPTYARVKLAAEYMVANGPQTGQERWENQSGWSPGTIAAEIAGLVTAADIARRNGDAASAASWEATADDWRARVEDWTATGNGPYSPKPYYLRVTKPVSEDEGAQPDPNVGTTYNVGDGGPGAADQRTVTDPSYLELVRLGVKRWDDPVIRNTMQVVDERLGVDTPNGRFWHRFDFDGYGETADGGPWDLTEPDTFTTQGRLWPIFAGERGEYELLAGAKGAARGRLASMARAGNAGGMIPEQVWDEHPPSGRPGFPRGEGTFSATPLAWSHAQLVRLAWSIDAGRPVATPRVVACRYAGC